MKKVLKSLLALTMVFGLCACGSSSKEESDEATVITVGISPDYEPYESLDKDDNIVGFDPDMLDLFEGYLKEDGENYTFKLVSMDFDNIITQIQGDQVDIGVSGFTYSDDRKVEWSTPYLGTAQVAVVKKGSDITSTDALKGKKLVAQTGATGEQAAKELSDDTTGLKDVQQIMNAVDAGQYDAAIIDSGVAKQYEESGKYTVLDGTLMDEKNYIIAKEGNTEIIDVMNKCIEKFLASDDYKTMCDKYGLVGISE